MVLHACNVVNWITLQSVPESQRRIAATIMWSEEQALILETFPKKMILENDFGTGND